MELWKKIRTVLFHGFAITLSLSLYGSADQTTNPLGLGTITVVSDDTYPPYIFRDTEGKLQGIIIDQWNLWEKKTGIRVNVVGMDWGKAQKFMADGKADVIDTMFYTEERAIKYDFTKPYLTIQIPVFFHKDISGISGPDSLQGFTVGVKEGDACIEILRRHGITTLKLYNSYEEIIKAAADHKIRVFCIDEPPALYYLYKMNIENAYRRSLPLYTGQFHRAVNKGRQDFLNVIEDGFSKISGNEYAEIDKRWMGSVVGFNPVYIQYVLYSSMAAALLVVILMLWNNTLRKRVSLKTSQIQLTLEALKESEQKHREVVDFLPISVFELDKRGIVTGTNRAALEAFGYLDEDVRNGINALDTLIPEDRDRASEYLQRVLNGESTRGTEYTSMRKDGSTFPVIMFSNPIIRGSKVVGIRGAVIDISDRRRAEDALISTNQQLNDIIEFLPDATAVIDKDKKFIAWNRAMEEMTGVSKAEMIGKGHQEGVVPFYGERRPYLLDLVDTSNHDLESRYPYVKRKGNTLHAETYVPCIYEGRGAYVFAAAAPLFDSEGNILGAIESIRDITEYKQAEEALRESQRRLEDIINFLPDATLVIDKDGKVIAWNRAIEAMTGVKAEEMMGKGNHEYSLPFYADRRPILIDLALHPNQEMEKHYTAIQRRGDIIIGEAFTPSLPPGDVHLSATASVLRDSKGDVIAAIECIRNNTERRRLEERLSRAEKMEALGTLAGGVAHDLNNVLGVLVGYSELLLEKIPKGDPLNRHVSHILQSSERGAAIIQDLLTLARRGVTVSEVINLNDVVLDYFGTPECEKLKDHHPNVAFLTDLEKNLLNIKGSPIHLEKAVMNLVSNAAEAISDGGLVMIRTENRYLDKPLRGYDDMQEGDYVVLTVSDNGKGISPADLGKIFEPFYTKKVMGRSGTGLGLAVVWGTVKDHDGYIDVQSEEGKGSTFVIYFPVTREELTEDQQKISPDQYMGGQESILVVDDVEGQRELAVSMLTRLGYRVRAVSSGEEAAAYIKSNEVDLLVLDMIMEPGIDGLETYQRILEINPKQKAVIVSGFSETDRVKKAQSLGAGTYVKKPYVLEKLGLAIKKELERPA